jgi:hypothetical protein
MNATSTTLPCPDLDCAAPLVRLFGRFLAETRHLLPAEDVSKTPEPAKVRLPYTGNSVSEKTSTTWQL